MGDRLAAIDIGRKLEAVPIWELGGGGELGCYVTQYLSLTTSTALYIRIER